MEITSKRANEAESPLLSIKNLPSWLKTMVVGDELVILSAKELESMGVPLELIPRLADKTLTLVPEFIKYMEITNGQFFGVMPFANKVDTIQCSVNWFKEVKKEAPPVFTPFSIIGQEPTLKDINEMISKVNRERLVNVFRYANGGRPVKTDIVDKYLEDWAKKKFDIYCMFGRNLTISQSVEFQMDDQEMRSLVDELMKKFPKYAPLLSKFEIKYYVSNQINSYYENWMERIDMKEVKGVKLSKFLSGLFEDEKFDVELSRVLQNSRVNGHYYISIDPYDFLTISTNKHGWKSCAEINNVREAGGNTRGAFSYLLDSTSMVAYRSNDKDYEYTTKNVTFVGNSKSWRQMVHINKNNCAIMFNRQYPNSIPEQSNVRELLEAQIAQYIKRENIWENLGNDSKYYNPSIRIAYNDSGNSSRITVVPKSQPLGGLIIDSGARIYCVECGRQTPDEEFVCRSCRGK